MNDEYLIVPVSVLYGTKVVIFLEKEPLTDKFEQLVLTKDQMASTLKHIESFLPYRSDGGFITETENTQSYTFPNIRPYYER